jgi:hypothetical protein
MKQVLFILLVFISFQGFSQSVKVKEIGLEVMTKDLGKMNWEDAKIACADLGAGWRLPTIDEFRKIYKSKDKIGGFAFNYYWSSTEYANVYAWTFSFNRGSASNGNKDRLTYYVRAVRTLK